MKAPSEVSQKLLCKQYLHKGDKFSVCDFCGQKHETLDEMFDRISFGNKAYREILSSFDFLPGSPTIFNAEAVGTLSSCFKFDVQDTMESIMDVGRKGAMTQKWGGGVGYCLSELRPKGAPIRSTHGKACGPVSVMSVYHSITEMITQGGKREGAQMAILHCNHPDIREFIHCKETEGELNTFNISVAVTDDFMNNIDGHPDSDESKLFKEIVECAWKNGDPGLFFIDVAERYNPTPHLGKLTGTNPCGEVPLLDNEACNLGSINLSHFVEGSAPHYFDFGRLKNVAKAATRYLDDVIDNNYYPVEETREATIKTRKIGLGVMGWADTLALMNIPYDSDKAIGLAKQIMTDISNAAYGVSMELGEKRGRFPADDGPGTYRRNACLTCIAPTGSISTIANCSSGIEPHYALEYIQVMGDSTPLKRTLDFGDFVPKTAHEIHWSWHIKHQVAFQQYTDLAVSKTINLPNSATVRDVYDAYLTAWSSLCKGITVYREGSRVKQAMYKGCEVPTVSRRRLPVDRESNTHKFSVGGLEGYLTMSRFPDNSLGEIFIKASKQGSTVNGLLDAVAILTSLALQYGVPLDTLVDKFKGVRFEPHGLTESKEIPTASSLLDYIFRLLRNKFLIEGKDEPVYSGLECPECGASVVTQEGCLYCSAKCGWSRC